MVERRRIRITEAEDADADVQEDAHVHVPEVLHSDVRNGEIIEARNGGKLQPVARGEHRGRKPGVPNRLNRVIREATLLACEQLGEPTYGKDGAVEFNGYDGLIGYMRHLGRTEPKTMGMLLAKIMPSQITMKTLDDSMKYETVDDVMAVLRSKGINAEAMERIATQVFLSRVTYKPVKDNG